MSRETFDLGYSDNLDDYLKQLDSATGAVAAELPRVSCFLLINAANPLEITRRKSR